MYRSGKRRKPLVSHVIRQKNLERFLGGGCESTTQTATKKGNIEEENELCTHLPEDCNNDLEDIDLLGVVTGNDPGTGNVGVNVVEGTIAPNRHESESDLESNSETSAPSSGQVLTESRAPSEQVHCSVIEPEVNPTYAALIKIHQLSMKNRVSLEFVDDIFRIARKYNGFDVTKCPLRDTFLNHCRKLLQQNKDSPHYVNIPFPKMVPVLHGSTLFPKFSLLDQIKDMLLSDVFQKPENLVMTDVTKLESLFEKYISPPGEELLEVHSGQWYSDTYDEFVTNPASDWLFPLIFYMDKTGTDAMQMQCNDSR